VYKIDIHICLKEFVIRKLAKSEGYFTLNLNTFLIILLVHIKDKSFYNWQIKQKQIHISYYHSVINYKLRTYFIILCYIPN